MSEEHTSKSKQLHNSLRSKGYLCTESFSDDVFCALKKKPMSITMLVGPAGTGKSFLPEVLGDVLNCNVYVKQAYQGMDYEQYVKTYVPDENTKSGIKARKAELLMAVEESKDKRVILLLDEWDKTRNSSDGFFLQFLQKGYISVDGKKYQANQDNLIIFFTSNNQREVDDALLRRFKVIEVGYLPNKLVHNVLTEEWKGNSIAEGFIGPCLKLYETSVKSKMDKPATMQELNDLIRDLVTYTNEGKEPDFIQLVRTNITKTEKNHADLVRAIMDAQNPDSNKRRRTQKPTEQNLDVSYFDQKADIDELESKSNGLMLKMTKLRKIDSEITYNEDTDKEVYAEFDRDDNVYTSCVIDAIDSGVSVDVPHFVDHATIKSNVIQLSKPYELREIRTEWSKFKRMKNSNGVVCFVERNASRDDVVNIIDDEMYSFAIRKNTDDEIVFRLTVGVGDEINARWKRSEGCEFICPTKLLNVLSEVIQKSMWYPSDRTNLNNVLNCVITKYHVETTYNMLLRNLGSSKELLNVEVEGLHVFNDDMPAHVQLYASGEATIQDTSRTTHYNMGWATVRSFHKKNKPNYKHRVVIKRTYSDIDLTDYMFSYKFICYILRVGTIPLFVSLGLDTYESLSKKKDKYKQTSSTRILENLDDENDVQRKRGYNLHAVNSYDRTTMVITHNSKSKAKSAFDIAKQLQDVRKQTLEVL